MRSLPGTDCERGVAKTKRRRPLVTRTIDPTAGCTRWCPSPLSAVPARPLGSSRRSGHKVCAISVVSCGRCVAAADPLDSRNCGTLEVQVRGNSVSRRPNTQQRLGGLHGSVNPFFCWDLARFFTVYTRRARDPGWRFTGAARPSIERSDCPRATQRPACHAATAASESSRRGSPACAARALTDSNSGWARSVPSGRVATLTSTSPQRVRTRSIRRGSS